MGVKTGEQTDSVVRESKTGGTYRAPGSLGPRSVSSGVCIGIIWELLGLVRGLRVGRPDAQAVVASTDSVQSCGLQVGKLGP